VRPWSGPAHHSSLLSCCSARGLALCVSRSLCLQRCELGTSDNVVGCRQRWPAHTSCCCPRRPVWLVPPRRVHLFPRGWRLSIHLLMG